MSCQSSRDPIIYGMLRERASESGYVEFSDCLEVMAHIVSEGGIAEASQQIEALRRNGVLTPHGAGWQLR